MKTLKAYGDIHIPIPTVLNDYKERSFYIASHKVILEGICREPKKLMMTTRYFSKKIIKQTRTNKRKSFIVFFCLILGLFVRLCHIIRYPVQPRDAYTYEFVICEWEKTNTISDQISFFPFSLLVLRIPNHFFNYDIIKGAVVINLLLGLLIISVSIHILGLMFKKDSVTLISGCIVATHPAFVDYSCSCLRENCYLFFSLLSLLFLVKYFKRTEKRYLFPSSLFAAIAFLCRLEGLEFFFVFLIIAGFLFFFKKMKFRTAFLHSVLYCFCFFSFVATICYFFVFNSLDPNMLLQRFDLCKKVINLLTNDNEL